MTSDVHKLEWQNSLFQVWQERNLARHLCQLVVAQDQTTDHEGRKKAERHSITTPQQTPHILRHSLPLLHRQPLYALRNVLCSQLLLVPAKLWSREGQCLHYFDLSPLDFRILITSITTTRSVSVFFWSPRLAEKMSTLIYAQKTPSSSSGNLSLYSPLGSRPAV